ncbi:unnamed protein product [Urochloa humidicola]
MAEENTGTQGLEQPRQTARTPMPRRSDMYGHFTQAQGDNKWQCKYCGLLVGANTKRSGTSNLWRHLKKCKKRVIGESHLTTSSSQPQPQPQSQLLPSGPGESSGREPTGLEEDKASRDLARMIALHGYDPSVVEDDYFKSFVHLLNPKFEVPSREAIDKMCSDIFQDYMANAYHPSTVYVSGSGKLSLAVGEAKTIQTGRVVYVTTHFIDHHWNPHWLVQNVYVVLPVGDYCHLPIQGLPMVGHDDVSRRIAHDIGILVLGLLYYDDYNMFMVAGEMIGHINHLKLKDCVEEQLTTKIYSATCMDHVLHSIARCLLPDSFFVQSTLHEFEVQQDTYKELLTQHGLAKLGLLDDLWEYGETWYSCYCCLEILAKAVPPNSDEYTRQLLRTLWWEIYRAIKTVSDSSCPTPNLCLQELFKVRDVLQSQLSKAPAGSYSNFGTKEVADILKEALQTVNKAIQDSYLVWSIPLILDPRYKIVYIEFIFQRAFGSEAEKYVSEVRTKTKELYTTYIEDDDEDSDGSSIEEMAADITDPLEQAWDEQCCSHDKTRNVDSHAEGKVELDFYLEDRLAPRTNGFDILNWWKRNSRKYPTVARMARDALAMPTCSKLTSDQMAHVRSMIRGYSDN